MMAQLLPREMQPEYLDEPRQGSCLCKRVEFEVKTKPFNRVLCHCKNCQKTSGSAFLAADYFIEANYDLKKGKENILVYIDSNNHSGNHLERWFCSSCSSQVKIRLEHNKTMCIVPNGLFDGAEWDTTINTEFYVDRRKPWLNKIRNAAQCVWASGEIPGAKKGWWKPKSKSPEL